MNTARPCFISTHKTSFRKYPHLLQTASFSGVGTLYFHNQCLRNNLIQQFQILSHVYASPPFLHCMIKCWCHLLSSSSKQLGKGRYYDALVAASCEHVFLPRTNHAPNCLWTYHFAALSSTFSIPFSLLLSAVSYFFHLVGHMHLTHWLTWLNSATEQYETMKKNFYNLKTKTKQETHFPPWCGGCLEQCDRPLPVFYSPALEGHKFPRGWRDVPAAAEPTARVTQK